MGSYFPPERRIRLRRKLSKSQSRLERKNILHLAYQRIGIYDLPGNFNRIYRLAGLAVFVKELLSKLGSPTDKQYTAKPGPNQALTKQAGSIIIVVVYL